MGKLKSFNAKTSQGPILQINEDDFDVDLRNQLFTIYDGFGGAGVGDRAVEQVKKNLKAFYTNTNSDPDSTLPFFYSPRYLIEGNALINAVKSAHKVLKVENTEKAMNLRAGVSLIAMASSESILTIASVGNCQSYLYRSHRLEVLSHSDCLKPIADDFERPFSLYPVNAVGLFDDLDLHVRELRLQEGDQILLLSDGVFGRLHDDEIQHFLEKNLEKSKGIDDLFQLANSRGNLDNQTVVVLHF